VPVSEYFNADYVYHDFDTGPDFQSYLKIWQGSGFLRGSWLKGIDMRQTVYIMDYLSMCIILRACSMMMPGNTAALQPMKPVRRKDLRTWPLKVCRHITGVNRSFHSLDQSFAETKDGDRTAQLWS